MTNQAKTQTSSVNNDNNSTAKRGPRLKSINLIRQNLISFEDLKIPENCASINVSWNRFKDFSKLPTLKKLTHLTMDDNPFLLSFNGATPQPSLYWVSFKRTPLSKHTHFKLMCTIVFGSKLKYINDEPVSPNLRQKADKLRNQILPNLIEGQILLTLSSLKYVIPQETRSCTAKFITITPNSEGESSTPSISNGIVQGQPSIAAICARILKEDSTDFLDPDKLEDIRERLLEMRDNFQIGEEEEEEFRENDESFDETNY